MTQDEINEWNKTNLLHMTNLKWVMVVEIMKLLKKQVKSKNDPNAHVGGPGWVNENEGYDSWKQRQQEAQEAVVQQ